MQPCRGANPAAAAVLGAFPRAVGRQIAAAGLELGQKAVSRMETGSRVIPDYELLWLAQALETTTAWLLGEEPET